MGSLKTGNYKNANLTTRFSERASIVNAPVRRPKTDEEDIARANPASSILLTGGIGDVFAIESYFTTAHKESLQKIFYATRQHENIKKLFSALPNYPNLTEHVVLWDDWSKFFDFCYKYQVIDALNHSNAEVKTDFVDWGIAPVFKMIKEQKLKYQSSSFLKYKLCEIIHFELPPMYVTICPYTDDKRLPDRDFTSNDWKHLIDKLASKKRYGVVINRGKEKIPEHPLLINLNNQTNLFQAIEIVKNSCGYIGIDSCLSVLAAKLFDYPDLLIKTVNPHCLNSREAYFAPRKEFKFLKSRIT